MRKNIPNNSKGALLFVAITLAGVALLIGTEDNEGALLKAAADMEKQGEAMTSGRPAQRFESRPARNEEHGITADEFSADEDLIDDASGFDPTPEIEPPLVSAEPQLNPSESSADLFQE